MRDAGFEFEVDPADIDESKYPPTLLPSAIATHLAEQKAKAVSARHPDDVILAADTVVALGDQALGKPTDVAHARKMLELLSGTTHLVITGVCVIHSAGKVVRSARVMSAVRMRLLAPREIDAYVATGLWEGKAGGYGIQDQDPFVVRQSGSRTNIVGLPMSATRQFLAEAGITPRR